MSCDQVKTASKKAVGLKQSQKAIEKGIAKVVYVAADADGHVVRPIINLCRANNIPVVTVESKVALGEACGIEVSAAIVAVVE